MTAAQMPQYRALVARAIANLGLDAEMGEKYRKAVMLEETGRISSRDVGATREYEAIMRRHAADAGDWELAQKFCSGDIQRYAAMCDDCARQIGELSGRPSIDRLEYLRGVLEQCGLNQQLGIVGDHWWEDYPTATAKQIFIMLDTHRRRLLKAALKSAGKRAPVVYRYGCHWGWLVPVANSNSSGGDAAESGRPECDRDANGPNRGRAVGRL